MKKLAILIPLLLCLSCHTTRTQSHTETVAASDYTHITSLIDSLTRIINTRDSSAVRDSVIIREKGDTVFIERWHTEYRERATADTRDRIKEVHDTITKTVTVTQKLYFTKTKEVNVLRWWQKALMWCGVAGLGIGAVCGAWKLGRRKLW